jgi:class 3 adenylate cyclase/tetratricopeptide (TPR) repeat protein
VRGCPGCGTENLDDARFCQACGTPLAEAAAPPRGARKTVTIVFTDVAGSTSLGERLDPEALRRIMTTYFDRMRAVLERHGGTVEKYIGDAIVAVFGLPEVHEDDAVRAVRAAAEMRDELEPLNEELAERWSVRIDARTGVNTGEVLAEDGGAQAPLTADAANVAARLEQAAGPGEILVGEATYGLVKDAVLAEPMEDFVLKGKAAPVAGRRLLEVFPEVPGLARRLDSPMVGRDRELSLLHEAFDAVTKDRACRLVTVLGVPGVGKSRLLAEFTRGLEGRATVLRGRCLPYGAGITFLPLAEIIKQAAGIVDTDNSDLATEKIGRLLGEDPEAAMITGPMASAVGLARPESPTQEIFWAVRRLLETQGNRRPLVAVFEDIHWGEPTFLDLLEYLAGWSAAAPILLVCAARPDLLETRPSWGGGTPGARTLRLEPLGEDESERLLENLLGRSDVGAVIRERITNAAEGNPLYVEEILRMLVDQRRLRRDDGRWTLEGDLSSISIPPTINALLAARLERLPTEERAALERAAVVGRIFWWGAVSELSPQPERPAVGGRLQALVRRELVRPDRSQFAGEDAFRFSHILIRDAAYIGIPKESRAGLHERFSGWLERKVGDRVAEYEEIIGYHLEQAHRYRSEIIALDGRTRELAARAARLLTSAGRRAFARTDIPATVNLLSRATALLPKRDPQRLAILPDLAEAVAESGDPGRGRELLEDILGGDTDDERLIALAGVTREHLGLLAGGGGSAPEGDPLAEAERAVKIFRRHGDAGGLARTYRLIGILHWRNGQGRASEDALEQAFRYGLEAGDPREVTESFYILGACLAQGPTPVDRGIKRARDILEQMKGNRTVEAYMSHALAHLLAWRGEFQLAREMAARYRTILRENGQEPAYLNAAEAVADVEMLAGNPATAVELITEAQTQMETRGLGAWDPTLYPFVARAFYVLGRYEEAAASAEAAVGSGHPLWQSLGKGTMAKVHARQERPEAEALAREAVQSFEQTDFPILHGHVLMDLAEVLHLKERDDEAVAALGDALRLFEEKGSLVLVEKAQDALAEYRSRVARQKPSSGSDRLHSGRGK